MSLIDDFKKEFRWSASGRTTCRNFWIYQLGVFALAMVGIVGAVLIGNAFGSEELAIGLACIVGVGYLILNIVGIFVTIRRLHDMGYSGWWYLAVMLAYGFASALENLSPGASLVVIVITLVCLSQKSQPGLNKYDVTE